MEIKGNVLLPNLVTVGNGICGFYAMVHLFKAQHLGPGVFDFADPTVFAVAAWLILLGMVFDVFDGMVARLSGGASALGAQLDSFCDLVTFGLAPAVMMLRLSIGFDPRWQRVVWFFSLAYFLCAMFRLARFTAENEPDDSAHVAFKGLPSPGAAGCVASVVIFCLYLQAFDKPELKSVAAVIEPATLKSLAGAFLTVLPPLGLLLGFAMVSSRLRFDHMGSRFFHRKHNFESYPYLIFGGVLAALFPEVIFPLVFLGYLVWTPAKTAWRYFLPTPAEKVHHADRTE